MLGKWDLRSAGDAGDGWWKKDVEPNHSLGVLLVLPFRGYSPLGVGEYVWEEDAPDAVLDPHVQLRRGVDSMVRACGKLALLRFLEGFDGGLDRLQTSVERARVHAEGLGVDGWADEVGGQLEGLAHAVGRQSRVCRVTRGRGELRFVFSSFVVDGPVQTVLVLLDQVGDMVGGDGSVRMDQGWGTYAMASEVYRIQRHCWILFLCYMSRYRGK